MIYSVLAQATMVVHFGFLAYVVFGGFVAWRFPRTRWLHVAAVGWGFGTLLIGIDCPLTTVENWAREGAGEAGLPPSGFIEHYLTGVVYPESHLALVRGLAAVTILVSWLGIARRSRGARHRRLMTARS